MSGYRYDIVIGTTEPVLEPVLQCAKTVQYVIKTHGSVIMRISVLLLEICQSVFPSIVCAKC